jgi:flagellar basal body-associated protein FliL
MFEDQNKQQDPNMAPNPANPSFNPPKTPPSGSGPSYGMPMPNQFSMPRNAPDDSGFTASSAPRQGMPGIPPAPPIRQPQPGMSIPITQQNVLTDEEHSEMLKRDKLSKVQKIILIVITVVVLGSLIGGGVWLVFSLDLFGTKTNTNANTNTNAVTTNANTNKKTNANANTNTVKTNTNTGSANTNATVNANANTNKTLNIITNAANTIDEDKDGLSGDQEIEYGTDPSNADTDGDGYTDGDEVKAGYNPIGDGKLVQ